MLKYLSFTEVPFRALNMDQIEKYDPPPNPAKVTDSRYKTYVVEYGDESWELDALEPVVFRELIEKEVNKIRDSKTWDNDIEKKRIAKERIQRVAREWDKKPTKKAARKPKRGRGKRPK